jgi:hypothetical protein
VTDEIRLRLELEIHRDRELHDEMQPTRSSAGSSFLFPLRTPRPY